MGVSVNHSNTMTAFFFTIFSILFLIPTVLTEKRVMISILTNDGFLLPAKVLAFHIKTLNMTVPYVLLVTENVSNASINELRSQDIEVRHTTLLTVPQAKKAAKYHYTKLRLWSMTEYDVIMYLDLDVLPLRDLTPFFSCGSFCATFRHSDKFNAGVLVLKPNLTVYNDLIKKAPHLPTYDGGDQGFLNSYFHELKYTPTFDHTHPNEQKYQSDQRRLSSEFNYDIGMYYLTGGKLLVEPAVIHYTLGPTKPWLWWTFPLFDLNEHWNNARNAMESVYCDPAPDLHLILFTVLVGVIALLFRKFILLISGDYLRSDSLSAVEEQFAHYLITWISFFITWNVMPTNAHPFASWMYFTASLNICIVCLSDIFVEIRCGGLITTSAYPRSFVFVLNTCAILLSLLVLSLVPCFGTRALLAIVLLVLLNYLFPLLCKTFLIGRHDCHSNYRLLPQRKECVH
uniref:glycogenin glucosyltransferase n=2 Tax=Haemonchus contortus TaxID=6289 RepID=A0A7I5EA62_HAECO